MWCPKKIQEVLSWTQDEASDVASDHDVEAGNEQKEVTGENNGENWEEVV